MSVLLVGLSHRSAPVDLLERVSLDDADAIKLSLRALDHPHVHEAVVLSTCNRVEIYVETDRFHGTMEDLAALLQEVTGMTREEFLAHAYVHYDEAAVAHVFTVAAGLDSMIVGESQILGQVRSALSLAQTELTVGTHLNALFQQALRVGKRGHAETGIDRLAPSLVTAGFDAAGDALDAPDARFLVAGAGTMSSLAIRTLIGRGIDPARVRVTNRTFHRAYELVAGHGVSAVRWDALAAELAHTDVLITCTGAAGVVFDAEQISAATADGRRLTVIDLAMPRDVAPDVRDLDHVTVVDLAVLADRAHPDAHELADEVEAVRVIVGQEIDSFLRARSAATVTPTVVALRSMATSVVAAEFDRLTSRLAGRSADLDDASADEIRLALQRVADKLIHAPTVRVKELSSSPEGMTYADALADLFALDPQVIDAVAGVGGDRP